MFRVMARYSMKFSFTVRFWVSSRVRDRVKVRILLLLWLGLELELW